MVMTREELVKHLHVLNIKGDISNITLRTATKAFHSLALKFHPDKVGDQSTAAFQVVLESYELVRKHFKVLNDDSSHEDSDSDDEDVFFFDNFEKFNFPFENNGSFTVMIEDHLANAWQDCMEKVYGTPKVIINQQGTECDRSWKTKHEGIEITVHIYNNPKNGKGSKLMIQGRVQSLICSFVFSELPKIYKLVSQNKPKILQSSSKPKNVKRKPNVKCDQCNFKSSLLQMKLHMNNVHASKPRRASKRTSSFTPISKPTKRSKSYESQSFNRVINSEGSVDDSILMLLDTPKKDILETLNEEPVPVTAEEHTQTKSGVTMKAILSCNLCEFDCENNTELEEHMNRGIHENNESHKAFQCSICGFSFETELLLQNHIKISHDSEDHTPNTHKDIKDTSYLCGQCDLCFDSLEECVGHVNTHMFKCFKCPFESKEKSIVQKHENHEHITLFNSPSSNANEVTTAVIENTTKNILTPQNRENVTCKYCNLESKNKYELNKHIENIHSSKPVKQPPHNEILIEERVQCSKCEHCQFIGSKAELTKHIKNKHSQTEAWGHRENTPHDQEYLNNHSSSEHTYAPRFEPFPCELCGLVIATFELLQQHMNTHNLESWEKCRYCNFTVKDKQSLEDHMISVHEDIVILHSLARQLDKLSASSEHSSESLNTFKEEMTSTLKALFDNQTILKQEMFLIRNSIQEVKANTPHPTSSSLQPSSTCPPTDPRAPSASTACSDPSASTIPSAHTAASSSPAPSACPAPPAKERINKKSCIKAKEILYIGDSISTNANFEALEEATESKFVRVKAYSAIHDTECNDAKRAAKFPETNFTDVIHNELQKKGYEHLVVQAGAVDISNLNTKDNPEKHIDYFKHKSIESATNIFNAASEALSIQPSLKSVVIMKQIPRYDPFTVDPLALKTVLSQLFNNTLTNLWTESAFRHKIFIGTHNIECSGSIREARYRHTISGRYDGIHLYGSSGMKAYTQSVLNILKRAKVTSPEYDYHQSCPQFVHQTRLRNQQRAPHNSSYRRPIPTITSFTVPLQNRFASFNSNQGNW